MFEIIMIIGTSYFLGAIPGSYLAALAAGYKIHRLGDGNVGAHNVMRHAGRRWGLLALAVDMTKGGAAVLLARAAGGPAWLVPLAALCAVIGHNYPVWLRFRGGKGLATSFGAALALFPSLAVLTLLCTLALVAITKNLAFTGVADGLLLALLAFLLGYPILEVLTPLGLLLLMAVKQFPDLRRMWQSTPDKRDLILNRWIRDRDAKL